MPVSGVFDVAMVLSAAGQLKFPVGPVILYTKYGPERKTIRWDHG